VNANKGHLHPGVNTEYMVFHTWRHPRNRQTG
jgi:hypothetical protein